MEDQDRARRQQPERERDLGDDERSRERAGVRSPAVVRAPSPSTSAGAVRAACQQRRQAGQRARDARRAPARRRAPSSPRRFRPRAAGSRRRAPRSPGVSVTLEQHAARRAGETDQQAFGEELRGELAAPGAERHARRRFARARDGARQQQSGGVRAGDQEQQRGGGEEQQQRRADVLDRPSPGDPADARCRPDARPDRPRRFAPRRVSRPPRRRRT